MHMTLKHLINKGTTNNKNIHIPLCPVRIELQLQEIYLFKPLIYKGFCFVQLTTDHNLTTMLKY